MQDSTLLGRLGICLIFALTFVAEASLNGQDGKTETESKTTNPADSSLEAAQELTKKQLDAIQIQMDTTGPIFVYDQSGGFRVAQPANRTPDFQLFADGRVVIGGSNRGMPKLESRLSDAQMAKFLSLVVNENRFYELVEKEIEKQMSAGKEKLTLVDAATTRFAIDLQQGKKEVSVYAIWNAVRNFPEIDELQRLSRIEKRCKMIISEIHLGDDGEQVLKIVNEAVAKLEQNIAPFTMDEIQNATRLTTGRFQVRFQRQLAPEKGANNDSTPPRPLDVIYFRNNATSKPEIKFYGLPQK